MPTVANEDELQRLMQGRLGPFLEIWVEFGERRMAALINGERGWITIFRHDGDEGHWTFNPDCESDETLEFKLDNGQVDQFPMYYCIDLDSVLRALRHFLRTGEADTSLNWGDTH